jgi:hypothetical protein
MKKTQLSETIVNRQAAIVADLLRDGFLDLYDGVQPDSPEMGVLNQVFLGSVRLWRGDICLSDYGRRCHRVWLRNVGAALSIGPSNSSDGCVGRRGRCRLYCSVEQS